MKTILLILVILIAAVMLYVRFVPTSAARWHTDPAAAPSPGARGVLVKPGAPNNPLRSEDPKTVLEAAEAAIRTEPRTKRIAGSPAEGMMTFTARSLVMGFPDYITVKATTEDDGTGLWMHSRLRFGQNDIGVNAKRSERILQRIDEVLGTGPGRLN